MNQEGDRCLVANHRARLFSCIHFLDGMLQSTGFSRVPASRGIQLLTVNCLWSLQRIGTYLGALSQGSDAQQALQAADAVFGDTTQPITGSGRRHLSQVRTPCHANPKGNHYNRVDYSNVPQDASLVPRA